ncbi:hypothetical protein P171DRAFT_428758 [Karstenula rhodostoma CBS 690.94]|uniref:Uncharacterized protein n=1 Tax=Karstenula rhodostoma CBS 690.94 TaxID=1392251 RepID=A0A9P4UEB8_9PLEO|nr:hypothetical protein P171DRAFT_428758 [Karstenula rhodostoma CBS 690.94]
MSDQLTQLASSCIEYEQRRPPPSSHEQQARRKSHPLRRGKAAELYDKFLSWPYLPNNDVLVSETCLLRV